MDDVAIIEYRRTQALEPRTALGTELSPES